MIRQIPVDAKLLGRCLVTGASGFIGRRLCQHLRTHNIVTKALLHKPGDGPWDEAVVADLCSQPLPPDALTGVNTVFHLAGKAHALAEAATTGDYQRLNVDGTIQLINGAAQAGVKRFIYFSSIKAMGEGLRKCQDESAENLPKNAYGLSKLEAEKSVLAGGQQHAMHVCNLRPTLVYGSGCKGNLHRMLAAIDRGIFPPLPETGEKRSMVELDDLIAVACLVAQSEIANGKTYIVSGGHGYSTYQLYKWMSTALDRDIKRWHIPIWVFAVAAWLGSGVGKILGKRMPFNWDVYDRLFKSSCYLSKGLENDFAWTPQGSFQTALPEMVACFRDNKATTSHN